MLTGKVARVAFGSDGDLLDPFVKDEEAEVKRAEDLTVSITTISRQLFSKYESDYKAKDFGNDYFALLSQTGIGNESKPTAKIHFVEHVDNMDQHITDPWADIVFSIEDFGSNEQTERLYLEFTALCQSLGGTSLNQMKNSFSEILRLAGSIFPGLSPWTSIGRVVVDGVNNILHKVINIKGETKSTTFSFFPFDSDAFGDAPLQTGSFVLFFEETDYTNMRMKRDGVVRSLTGGEINPYIVVNVKRKLVVSVEQLNTAAAVEVLNGFNNNYGHPLPRDREPALRYFDALEELGKSYRTAQYAERYFTLKKRGGSRSESEEKRFQKLGETLRDLYDDWDLVDDAEADE